MAIATGSGQVLREFDFMEIKGTPKASTAITKGQVLVNWNGQGYRPSFSGGHGPYYVALEAAASAASPSDIKILKRGVVKLTAQAAVSEGEWVIPAVNAGEVTPFASPKGTADIGNLVGAALEDVSAGATGKFLLGY